MTVSFQRENVPVRPTFEHTDTDFSKIAYSQNMLARVVAVKNKAKASAAYTTRPSLNVRSSSPFIRSMNVTPDFKPERIQKLFDKPQTTFFHLSDTIDNDKYPPFATYGDPTHPIDHRDDDFRYHVYSYNAMPNGGTSFFPAAMHGDPAKNDATMLKNEYYQSKVMSYQFPDQLPERMTLSTSFITPEHRATYGSAGYLIETSNSNVIAAREADLWVNNWQWESVHAIASEGRLSTEMLMRLRTPGTYNEVLIGGEALNQGPIRITGVFYKVDKDGQPLDPRNAAHFKRMQESYKLKAVAIRE